MARNLYDGVSRDERSKMARALKAQGFLNREIAEKLGISVSYASTLIVDPDASKERNRKERYRGVCSECGAKTTHSSPGRPVQRCYACTKKRESAARKWTPERIIADIQRWNEIYGEPPKAMQWLIEVKGDGTKNSRPWPHVNAVQREFGSWSNGLEAAGFKRRINYERTPEWKAKRRKWSNEKLIEKLREWAQEHGCAPKTTDWHHAANGYPSHTSVALRFGSWENGLRAAGLEPSPRKYPIRQSKQYLATPFEQREGKPLIEVVQEMNSPGAKPLTQMVQELERSSHGTGTT